MIKPVLMPQFGATMLTGTIVKWLKKERESIKKGEPLMEVMSDKAVLEVESFETGILRKILVPENEEVPVSQVVAYIGEETDAIPDAASDQKEQVPASVPQTAEVGQPVFQTTSAKQGRLFVSPIARKMAEENGIDLTNVQGTEPGGRIGKADVLRAIEKKKKLQQALASAGVETEKPAEFFLPKMTDNMSSGVVVGWLCKSGASVEKGQPILEIETDKATQELESPASGILTIRPGIEQGVEVPVGETLAYIAAPGVKLPMFAPFSGTGTHKDGDLAQKDAGPSAQPDGNERLRAVPIARRLARDLHIDLSLVKGTGADGLIVEKDVRVYAEAQAAPKSTESASVSTSAGTQLQAEEVEWVELTNIQRVTGQRMLQSVQNAPQFALSLSVDMIRLMEFRQTQLTRVEAATGKRLSVTSILVKVVGMVLREYPRANASFEDKRIKLHKHVNIGVAVGTQDGLVVPVIKDADRKSLVQITQELNAFQEKAERMHFSTEDLMGGTFTISNLGMFGIECFQAIINPPESAILAVGNIVKLPTGLPDGSIALRPMMKLTLSIDHRVLDGLQGAQVLSRIKEIIEQPYLLVD